MLSFADDSMNALPNTLAYSIPSCVVTSLLAMSHLFPTNTVGTFYFSFNPKI